AFSAGALPGSALNPVAVETLETLGHDVSGLRPKSVAAFQGPDAPPLDFVFTVCDHAANAELPPWPGQPMTGHWSVPDPAGATGADADRRRAFLGAYRMLERRIAAFAALPFDALDAVSLQQEIDRIGVMDAAEAAG
ncbi:MAG: ArsR family transcriptional regulator, partial [Rhodobacteraceae bacterium]